MALHVAAIFVIVFVAVCSALAIFCCCCFCCITSNPLCGLATVLATLHITKPRSSQREPDASIRVPRPQYGPQDHRAVPAASAPPLVYTTYNAVPVSDKQAPPALHNQHGVQGAGGARDPELRALLQTPTPPPGRILRDPLPLLVFIVQLGILAALAVSYGLPALGVFRAKIERGYTMGGTSGRREEGLQNLLLLSAGLAVIADVLSLLWLHAMLCFAGFLIPLVLWSTTAICTGLALASVLASQYLLFMVFALLTLSSLGLLYNDKTHVHLSSANLRLACRAVSTHLGLLFVAYGAMVVQLGLVILWVLAALGSSYRLSSDPPLTRAAAACLVAYLTLSFYWGQQVVQNVLKSTVAGVVASYWFTPDEPRPVVPALIRASTFSLGSICLGSLLIAMVESLRAMVQAMWRAHWLKLLGACMADALLTGVESIWRQFNRFAIVFVGVYGYDFNTASSLAVDLLSSRGWDVIFNDYAVSMVLLLGSVTIGALTGCLGVWLLIAYPHIEDSLALQYPKTVVGVIGLLLGLACSLVLSGVVSSGVDTVLVCFAVEPSALEEHHPEEHAQVCEAWHQLANGQGHDRRSSQDLRLQI